MKKTRILVLLLTLLLTLSCLTLPLLAAAEPAAEDPSATASADASADASGDAQDTAEQESSQEVIVSADPSFTVAAKAALLIDLNTGRTVYEQDADERVYPASLTKIMTCLLALENGNLSDVITVDESALSGLDQDSSVVGLKVGEQITLENLLYCMMVSSGNDAANVVAEYIAGSVADFVRMMNERAYALGCKDTHFNNPHGLHDESHYTTARDLAIITQAALKSENFRQIVDTAEYVIPASATGEEHKLKTTNMLIYKSTGNSLYYSRATGVKTGYTSAAGRCLIATAEDDGIRFLSVLCGAKTSILDTGDLLMESFPETIKLLDYGFDNFSYVTALSPLYPIDQVTVLNSAGSEAVAVAPAKDVRLLLPANYNPDALRTEILLDAKEVEAPVSEGQKLGLARVYYGNELIDETDLLAIADVTRSEFSSVPLMMKAYQLFSAQSDYPLHVGVTETGTEHMGVIKSAMGIGGLLCMGIGDTIRVSLTADPVREVYAAHDILKAAGLRHDGVNIVACPTCGRTRIDLISLASRVEAALRDCKKPITVAVMGCVVNGPGEAREADVGIAGGDGVGMLFAKGEMIQKLPYDELLPALLSYIDTL